LKDLAVEGAVPERRVAEAAHVLEEAKAAQLAAQRRSSQFHRLDQNVGRSDGAVVLRSPIAGVVDEVFVTVGAFVQIGDPLFRVIDASELWIEARVPVAQIAGVRNLTAAWFLVEGRNAPIELDASALVARGQAVDPTTLTVPVVFTTGNTASGLPIGAVGDVFLQTEESYSALAVPQTAVVDDGGTPVVFVQVEGESFERRVVRLGAKDAHYVEVRQGLQEGEHVVSLGGWSIKLAASSGVVPAHGHAH
jgi:RND family efflux transporter MFP subunit